MREAVKQAFEDKAHENGHITAASLRTILSEHETGIMKKINNTLEKLVIHKQQQNRQDEQKEGEGVQDAEGGGSMRFNMLKSKNNNNNNKDTYLP